MYMYMYVFLTISCGYVGSGEYLGELWLLPLDQPSTSPTPADVGTYMYTSISYVHV